MHRSEPPERTSVPSDALRLHRPPVLAVAGLFLGLAAGCSSAAGHDRGLDEPGPPAGRTPGRAAGGEAWQAPPLGHVTSVRDGRTGERIALATLFDRLAAADVVFLGETHLDETTHRFEEAVLAALDERRDGRVVLSLEMFERDVQEALDDYLDGHLEEPEFLARARPWSNYRTAYRRLVEHAKASDIPVVAANFPAPLRRRIAFEGEAAIEALSTEERALLPAEFLPNRPPYWRRVDNAVRGHLAMMGGPKDPGDPRLYDGQSLWDNAMGEACAQALAAHPGATVLHVNGGFHTQYWDGTAHQLRVRAPEADVVTVDLRPTASPASAELGGASVADYVVFVEAIASDVRDGLHAVAVQRDLRYRLHVPEGASDDAPVPLLVWLGDAGATPEEGLALWRARLGDACAIAVVEAPYRETREDLVEAGRWSWPDTFLEDMGALAAGIEELRGYVARNLPVDPERTLVAGEGAGGTVAVAAALRAGRLATKAFAIAPRYFTHLADMPLPLPELAGPEGPLAREVHVEVPDVDRGWWSDELAQHQAVGIPTSLAPPARDPWAVEAQRERKVRALLRLPQREGTQQGERDAHVVGVSPRAARWARIRAAREGGVRLAVLEAPPEGDHSVPFAPRPDPAALAADPPPRCPGPFGGTTVLVLPEDLDPSAREAWLALEADDPLAAASRFHRLRIATLTGERSLAAVLSKLLEEDRTNALVLPAEFCADAGRMRELRDHVGPAADRLTLHWLPGLGAPR